MVAHGARVVVLDVNEPAAPFPENSKLTIGSTVSKDNWDTAFRLCQQWYGDIPTVLVQSAGVPARSYLLDTTLEELENAFSVNVSGTFLGMQGFISRLKEENRAGSIVNIASIAGVTAMHAGTAYEATKAACVHLSRNVAFDYAKDGFRVNCVNPGLTVTGMTSNTTRSPEAVQKMLSHVPMARWGTAEEVAYSVMYLASDEASYVTGTVFNHDGGYTTM